MRLLGWGPGRCCRGLSQGQIPGPPERMTMKCPWKATAWPHGALLLERRQDPLSSPQAQSSLTDRPSPPGSLGVGRGRGALAWALPYQREGLWVA